MQYKYFPLLVIIYNLHKNCEMEDNRGRVKSILDIQQYSHFLMSLQTNAVVLVSS